RLGPQGVLGLPPQRRRPVPQLGAAQKLTLEALPALPQLRGRLKAAGEPVDPRLELTAVLVAGIGGHGRHRPAQARVTTGAPPPGTRTPAASGATRTGTAPAARCNDRRDSGRRRIRRR